MDITDFGFNNLEEMCERLQREWEEGGVVEKEMKVEEINNLEVLDIFFRSIEDLFVRVDFSEGDKQIQHCYLSVKKDPKPLMKKVVQLTREKIGALSREEFNAAFLQRIEKVQRILSFHRRMRDGWRDQFVKNLLLCTRPAEIKDRIEILDWYPKEEERFQFIIKMDEEGEGWIYEYLSLFTLTEKRREEIAEIWIERKIATPCEFAYVLNGRGSESFFNILEGLSKDSRFELAKKYTKITTLEILVVSELEKFNLEDLEMEYAILKESVVFMKNLRVEEIESILQRIKEKYPSEEWIVDGIGRELKIKIVNGARDILKKRPLFSCHKV